MSSNHHDYTGVINIQTQRSEFTDTEHVQSPPNFDQLTSPTSPTKIPSDILLHSKQIACAKALLFPTKIEPSSLIELFGHHDDAA